MVSSPAWEILIKLKALSLPSGIPKSQFFSQPDVVAIFKAIAVAVIFLTVKVFFRLKID